MHFMLLTLALFFESQILSGFCDGNHFINKRFVKIKAPEVVDPNQKEIMLQCIYGMSNDNLFSINWFKDGNEFFRCVFPIDRAFSKYPNIDAFNVQDVLVNMTASNATHIFIQQYHEGKRINITGSYGCQISGEGPEFHVMYDEVNVTVDVIPACSDTVLKNIESDYGVGDTLTALCESVPAYFSTQLTFFMNGLEVKNSTKFKLVSNEINLSKLKRRSILIVTSLQLSVILEPNDFNDTGSLCVVCRSCLRKNTSIDSRRAKAILSLIPARFAEAINNNNNNDNNNTNHLKQSDIINSSSAASPLFLSTVITTIVQIPILVILIFTYTFTNSLVTFSFKLYDS